MGALLALCEGGQTFSLLDLRLRLEGQRKQAKTDPGTEPDVYVDLLQVRWAEGQRFSPLKFALRDVRFEVEVEIHGSAEGGASRAAPRLLGKVSDRLAPTAGALQKTLRIGKALSTRTMHRVRADLAVDLLKALERHVAQAISTKVGEMASRMAKESSDRLARCGQDKSSKMRARYDAPRPAQGRHGADKAATPRSAAGWLRA